MSATERPDILGPAPVFYLMAFLLVPGLHWFWPSPIVDQAWIPWLGRVVLFSGLALNAWGVWSMKRHRTPINPYRPAQTLVTEGPFRISRNPLYVGLHIVLLGLVLILDTVWGMVALLALVGVIHFGVIRPEERYLDARFGDTYRTYCTEVRRYL